MQKDAGGVKSQQEDGAQQHYSPLFQKTLGLSVVPTLYIVWGIYAN